MLQALHDLVAPAALERLVLLANHILSAEPVAMQRMAPHAGRRISLEVLDWPALLPRWPVVALRITPAGLLEWCGPQGLPPGEEADLQLRVQASDPAALALAALSGQPPPVQLQGDAQLAADVNWLIAHVRWDVAADLERLFGPAAAHRLADFLGALARSVAEAVRQAGSLVRGAATAQKDSKDPRDAPGTGGGR